MNVRVQVIREGFIADLGEYDLKRVSSSMTRYLLEEVHNQWS